MSDMELNTAFVIFGLPFSSTPKEVIKQYRKKARLYHPDKCKDKEAAHKTFVGLKTAYDVIIRYVESNNRNREPTEREIRANDDQRRAAREHAVWEFFYEEFMAPKPDRPAIPPPPPEPTEGQRRMMDRQRVLATTLDNIRQRGAPSLPITIRTWRQLKRWLEAHPIEAYSMEDILNLQAVHCAHALWHEDTSSDDEPHPNEGGRKRKRHESDSESECSAEELTSDEDDDHDIREYYGEGVADMHAAGADVDLDELSDEEKDPKQKDPKVSKQPPKEWFRKAMGFPTLQLNRLVRAERTKEEPKFW